MQELDFLNDAQQKAVVSQASRLLILAGAGSGKTSVLSTRIFYLLQKFPQQQALALTFSNRACAEMAERVQKLSASTTQRVMIKTFHSFGTWVLRRYGELLGLSKNFNIYDQSDSLSILRPLAHKKNLKTYLNAISRARENGIVKEEELRQCSAEDDFFEVYHGYMQRLRRSGNVDFTDLMCLPKQLIQSHKEVRQSLQQRFPLLFVDEFQDTSSIQLILLKELCCSYTQLTVVGDDDQSIYSFRGANIENMVSFSEYFPDAKILRLEENYRSTPAILDLANKVIARNISRLGKNLYSRKKGYGDKPQLLFFRDFSQELVFVLQLYRQDPAKELAILYRNNAQSLAFEEEFRKQGLSYRLLGGQSFFAYEEIKTTIAYLAFFLNPFDQLAFGRMVNKPTRGLGKVAQEAIAKAAKGGDYLSGLQRVSLSSKKSKEGCQFLVNLEKKFQQWLTAATLEKLFFMLIHESGVFAHYRKVDEQDNGERTQRLQELIVLASRLPQGIVGVLQLLELASLEGQKRNSESSNLILATMHSTKGLEFERVFISGLEEGLFPSPLSYQQKDIEEERRLFYVAITRTREQLYLSYSGLRILYGRPQENPPSAFIKDLPWRNIDSVFDNRVSGDETFVGRLLLHKDYGRGTVVAQKKNLLSVKLSDGRVIKVFSDLQSACIVWL